MAGEPPYYYPQPQPIPPPYPMATRPMVAPPPYGAAIPRLAVAALVAALVAVIGVLVLAVAFVSSGAPMFGGATGDDVLTGTVEPAATGTLAGPDLKAAVQARIEDDGADVTAMICPDTPRVAQGVVTVCHGSIDGSEWAVVVLLEDGKGAYTLLLI